MHLTKFAFCKIKHLRNRAIFKVQNRAGFQLFVLIDFIEI